MNNLIQHLPSHPSVPSSSPSSSLPLSIDLIFQQNNFNNCNELIQKKSQLNLLSNSQHSLFQIKIKLQNILQNEIIKLTSSSSSSPPPSSSSSLQEKSFPNPLVTLEQNFDHLLIPKDHYCRRPSDVYYATENVVLRTHLTAHLKEIITSDPSLTSYFLAGPVFRRLEEDDVNSELSHQVSPSLDLLLCSWIS